MCGIAGIVALSGARPVDERQLQAMCDVMLHRGPDEQGLDIVGSVGLGMRRLSIIDVEGGHQPILNEDGAIRAVFNGEIYNFRELRQDLEAGGHRMRSAADGEVIVHLYEEYGEDFVSRLNGMYAIALYDGRNRRILLVRDRLGIKPLFYTRTGGHLVFGSEIKCLLASGLVERSLDVDALGQFVAWEYVPAPQTLFEGVKKLEPGSLLRLDLDSGAVEIRRYWEIPAPCCDSNAAASGLSEDDWHEKIDALLKQCVQRRLVSDVPLGAFLSGGVDSSLIVSAMGDASTFSIGFSDRTYDESGWAAKVARHLGVNHHVDILEPDIGELFDYLMTFMDDPIGDFSILPTYLVSKFARQHVKVVLTGDGGDELFGGYETYLAQDKARIWSRIPGVLRKRLAEPLIASFRPTPAKKGLINKAKRFVEGVRHDVALGHARWRLFVGDALRAELFTPEARAEMTTRSGHHILRLEEEAGNRGQLDRALYVDVRSYLVDNCLVKVDRMSMAASLEARVPFLDHELVEAAFTVPESLKVRGGQTKVLLKRIAASHVPRECVYRPKEGFSIPIKHWLCNELRPLMEDLLDSTAVQNEGIFQVETLERLKREHLEGTENHSHVLWALMVFRDWKRRWRV